MKPTLIIFGVLALLGLLLCMGLPLAIVEVPFTLAFGWANYILDVLPTVHVNGRQIYLAFLCLTALLLAGHAMAKWLWQETALRLSPSPGTPGEGRGGGLSSEPDRAASPPWCFRWTLAATSLILLTFTAGLAATGVAHQSAWLASSETPMFVNSYGRQDTHDQWTCGENLEQIGYALRHYTTTHAGRYPDALADLSPQLNSHYLACPAALRQRYPRVQHPADRPEYSYYARGLEDPLPARTPLASEPITNHKLTGLHILYSDGTVQFHTPADAQRILSQPAGTP